MASGIVDIAAAVITNQRLSEDYNVVALAAPKIAARVAPGQFVMIKAGAGCDPLLRRPFSVFELLRSRQGDATGLSILSKRIGPSTRALFEAAPGDTIACLGPLGRPFTLVEPPAEAWMVAGGVGLAPFATLAELLRARSRVHVVLRRAARGRAVLSRLVPQARRRARADDRGWHSG